MSDEMTEAGTWASTHPQIGETLMVEFIAKLEPAPCWRCGGKLRKGEGLERTPPTAFNLTPWRRAHEACETATVPDTIRRFTRLDLSDNEAIEAALAVDVPLTAQQAAEAGVKLGSRPWSWIGKSEKAKLTRAVTVVLARQGAGLECVDGPCGWCGRRRSSSWAEGPTIWRAGRQKQPPLCSDCAARWEASDYSESRGYNRTMALSMFLNMGITNPADDGGMKVHAETCDKSCLGHERPWGYSAGLMELKERAYRARPFSIRDPHERAVYLAILESEWTAEQEKLAANRPPMEAPIEW